ncbi:MAG: hypothetical protein KDK72_07250, partial [Chlamydiia bacterium]|nr:hypothetical protein [Chlamydiia bacterium]
DAAEFIEQFQNSYEGTKDESTIAEGVSTLINTIEKPELTDAIDFAATNDVLPEKVNRIKEAIEQFRKGKTQQELVSQVVDQGFWKRVTDFHEDLAALARDDTLKKIEVTKSEGGGL